MRAAALAGSIVIVAGSLSAKTGVAPQYLTAFAVAT
jgi:hypothetical protein